MKKTYSNNSLKFFITLLICGGFLEITGASICVRKASSWGFFAEFLWVVNHIQYCLEKKKIPVINWGKDFAYYSTDGFNGSKNGWEYYFEPVSKKKSGRNQTTHKECWYETRSNFSALWDYGQYLANIHLLPPAEQTALKPIDGHLEIYASQAYPYPASYPVGDKHLYAKAFREKVKKEIIDPFIKIKPGIQAKIEFFYQKRIKNKKTIGIHLRGNHIGGEVLPVSIKNIIDEANKHAEFFNVLNKIISVDYQFFIATDQAPLIAQAKRLLNGNVIYYECERFQDTTSPYPGKKLHPKLGEDLLIETVLLSRCDHLVHTISNVSTAALYFNPELPHTLIY